MLRLGGRTAYLTIIVSPGLTKAAHRRAVRLGPRAIASTRPLDALMTAAGFIDVEITDVTEEFLATARGWYTESGRHERQLRNILGDELDERQSHRRAMIGGVEEGLLRRVLVGGGVSARAAALG
jgi:hypothetical protein